MQNPSDRIVDVCDLPEEVKTLMPGVLLEQWEEWWCSAKPLSARVYLLAYYELFTIEDLAVIMRKCIGLFRDNLDTDVVAKLTDIIPSRQNPYSLVKYASWLDRMFPGLKSGKGQGKWYLSNIDAYLYLIFEELSENAWPSATRAIMFSVCLEDIFSLSLYRKHPDFQLRVKPKMEEFHVYDMEEGEYEDVL